MSENKGTEKHIKWSNNKDSAPILLTLLALAFCIGVIFFLILPVKEKLFGYFITSVATYMIYIYGFSYWRIFIQNKATKNKLIKTITSFIIVTLVFVVVFIVGPTKIELLKNMADNSSFSLQYVGGLTIVLIALILIPILVVEELIDKTHK